MISPRRTALYIAIGAMAFAAGEAGAGCKYLPYPDGTYFCASYIKGSTECKLQSFGAEGYGKLTNPECYITGVNQYSYNIPEWGNADAFCSTGSPPNKECIADPIPVTGASSIANASLGADAAKKKPKKPKDCKPKKKGKDGGKGKGDGDDDNDCTQRSGAAYPSATFPAPDCVEDPDTGVFDCTTQGKVNLGDCTTDQGYAGTYVATEFLGIAFACVTDPEGVKTCNYADPLYQYCTLDSESPSGYDCTEIYTGAVGPWDPPPQVPPPEPTNACNSFFGD